MVAGIPLRSIPACNLSSFQDLKNEPFGLEKEMIIKITGRNAHNRIPACDFFPFSGL